MAQGNMFIALFKKKEKKREWGKGHRGGCGVNMEEVYIKEIGALTYLGNYNSSDGTFEKNVRERRTNKKLEKNVRVRGSRKTFEKDVRVREMVEKDVGERCSRKTLEKGVRKRRWRKMFEKDTGERRLKVRFEKDINLRIYVEAAVACKTYWGS